MKSQRIRLLLCGTLALAMPFVSSVLARAQTDGRVGLAEGAEEEQESTAQKPPSQYVPTLFGNRLINLGEAPRLHQFGTSQATVKIMRSS